MPALSAKCALDVGRRRRVVRRMSSRPTTSHCSRRIGTELDVVLAVLLMPVIHVQILNAGAAERTVGNRNGGSGGREGRS